MPGILDLLTGGGGGNATPFGLLNYPSPLNEQDPDQAALAAQQAAALGIPVAAVAKGPDVFGDPSKLSVASPGMPPPQDGFGAGATPFGFAGPGSNDVAPGMLNAASAAPPQAAATPLATDPSSVNKPAPAAPAAAPDSVVNVGGYQMPQFGQAPDEAGTAAAPAPSAAPASPVAPGAPSPAPFSLGGGSPNLGSRLQAAIQGSQGARGLIPKLFNFGSGLATGQRADLNTPALNATVTALVGKGASPQEAAAAVGNPALMSALISQYYGKDHWKVVQTGQDGLGNKTFMEQNSDDGSFRPIPGQGAGNSAAATGGIGDMTKAGDAYLATVPKQQANIIQQMVAGTIPPPSAFALAKPYWQGMLAAAKNYDPSFDETKWSARNAMARSAQGDGKMGQNINAITTGIGHLQQLYAAIPGLNNSNYSQTYNRIGNAVSTEFGGTGATNFNSIRDRVAPEIVKIWRGSGGAEADIKRDIDALSTSQTPDQLRGAISNIAGLMQSKLDSNMQEYKATMGRDMPLTPQQQQQMAMIEQLQGLSRGGSSGGAGKPSGSVNVGGKSINWSVN